MKRSSYSLASLGCNSLFSSALVSVVAYLDLVKFIRQHGFLEACNVGSTPGLAGHARVSSHAR